MRRGILERFRAAYGDRPFALLPPEWIEALLDAKPPHAARSWLVTLRSLCQFAVKRGWLRTDPTRDIKQRSIKSDGFQLGPTTRSRNSRRIIRSAASRDSRSRCCSTPHNGAPMWSAWGGSTSARRDGPALYVKQHKTGVELLIPIYPELQTVLDATPSEHLTFLVTATGKPYGGNAFSEQFRNWCDAAGLPKRC